MEVVWKKMKSYHYNHKYIGHKKKIRISPLMDDADHY